VVIVIVDKAQVLTGFLWLLGCAIELRACWWGERVVVLLGRILGDWLIDAGAVTEK
jgi:hypothetical protein